MPASIFGMEAILNGPLTANRNGAKTSREGSAHPTTPPTPPIALPKPIYRRNPDVDDSALEILSGSNAQYGRVGVAMLRR